MTFLKAGNIEHRTLNAERRLVSNYLEIEDEDDNEDEHEHFSTPKVIWVIRS